jgi:hypothetical protein
MDDFSFEATELIEIKLSTNYPNTRINAIGGIARRAGVQPVVRQLSGEFSSIEAEFPYPAGTKIGRTAWKNMNDHAGHTDSANKRNRMAGTSAGWASSEWRITICVGASFSAVFGVACCLS